MISIRAPWSRLAGLLVFPLATAMVGAEQPESRRVADQQSVAAVVPIAELSWVEGKGPPTLPDSLLNSPPPPMTAVIDGDGEVFVDEPASAPRHGPVGRPGRMAVSVPRPRDVEGTLRWPTSESTWANFRFRIPADRFTAEQQSAFLKMRLSYYESLMAENLPGAAWFRHQARATRVALGLSPDRPTDLSRPAFIPRDNVDASFELLSGERAIHENLQLDQQLLAPTPSPATVPLDSLAGITVREIDWQPFVAGKTPTKDALSRYIPDDQHAVFFPSFSAFAGTLDALQQTAGPALAMVEPGVSLSEIRARYERQLGISLDATTRLLGPQFIEHVAITGGDPYLRTGTDIALLFHSATADMVEEWLRAQIAVAAEKHENHGEDDVSEDDGRVGDVSYEGWRNPSRALSSYVARVDDVVVLSNSRTQLRRILDTAAGRAAALAALPEYTFFRDRYRLEDSAESALVVITDKTIRRWCGPRWRIAAARRTRAAAVLADVRAAQLKSIVAGTLPVGLLPDTAPAATGPIAFDGHEFRGETYGGEDFLTPIVELEFDKVTADEAERYRAWRDRYQNYWRNAFDPIALRLSVARDRLAFDLTVMPLIDNTQYRSMRDLARGVQLQPRSGDPHPEAVLHTVLGFNPKGTSNEVQSTLRLLRFICVEHDDANLSTPVYDKPSPLPGEPTRWLGQSLSLYLDADPAWEKLGHSRPDDLERIHRVARLRLPVAARIEVTNQQELAAAQQRMLSLLKGVLPSLTREERTHRDVSYVRLWARKPEPLANFLFGDDWEMFSLSHGDQWLMSFNERLIQRAIDRSLDGHRASFAAPAWLGDHVAMRLNDESKPLVQRLWSSAHTDAARRASYGNLPILNHWKRLFPQEDPVALHERAMGARLECAGGGQYVWNADELTMESTVFGHPGRQRETLIEAPFLKDLRRLSLGLSFEEEGLRARGEWLRHPPTASK